MHESPQLDWSAARGTSVNFAICDSHYHHSAAPHTVLRLFPLTRAEWTGRIRRLPLAA